MTEVTSGVGARLKRWRGKLSGDSLKARCARGSMILGVGAFGAKALGFASKMLLTRLLLPQEMGLAVMILSLTALFEVLTEVGIKQSVIQHKDGARPEYLNMAWWFQAVRGLGLYAVAFLLVPCICGFYFQNQAEILGRYAMPELTWLVRVALLSVAFNAILSPRAHVLEKELKFGRAAIILQGGFALGTTVTVALAVFLKNAWAIAIGFAGVGFFRCFLSYAVCPFIPRFRYDRDSLRSLYRFARGMLGLPLLAYIAFSADILIAGKLVVASGVGFYGMARVLAMTVREFSAQIINPVLTAAIAEKQDDMPALRDAILRLTKLGAILLMPALFVSILFSSAILSLVFGSEYSVVGVPFSLFCINGVFLVQGTPFVSLYFGIGEPSRNRTFLGVRAVVLLLMIYPGIKLLGLSGAATAVLVGSIVALCMQVRAACRTLDLSVWDYLKCWIAGLLWAVPVPVLFLVLHAVWPSREILHVVVAGLGSVTFALAGAFRFWRAT